MKKTSNAVEILHRRFVTTPARRASVEKERVNAEVASLIFGLRARAGLTQKELARRIGTTQSAISRLEDADYGGHSLSMLNRVADALGYRVTLSVAKRRSPPATTPGAQVGKGAA